MFKNKKRDILIAVNVLLLFLATVFTTNLIPKISTNFVYSSVFTWITDAIIYLVLVVLVDVIIASLNRYFDKKRLFAGESSILTGFTQKLKTCYSFEEFFEVIKSELESHGNYFILFENKENGHIMYHSENDIVNVDSMIRNVDVKYNKETKDGYYFMDKFYYPLKSKNKAKGFALCFQNYHLYIMTSDCKNYSVSIFLPLLDEYSDLILRSKKIEDLERISDLSKDWQNLSVIQNSFLPKEMPVVDRLEIASYYKPYINVSGDYYQIYPLSPSKTLFIIGDVSGKGLGAALIMSVVLNTIKVMENKEDIPSLVKAIDKAIKAIQIKDKYTIFFMGILDTENMSLDYVNASMNDPYILTRAPDGYRIKPIPSNMSVVGIIDVDDVPVSTLKLFNGDVLFMSTDGFTGITNKEGVNLGTSKLLQKTIKDSGSKSPKAFVQDMVDLIGIYSENSKISDDITMVVAKVER